jgi:uncharacterized protein DUF4154
MKYSPLNRPVWIRVLFVLLILLSTVRNNFSQKIELSREYQIKAVFLYNLSQFVEWPKNAFENDQAPIVIGILGTDPFGKYLEETVQGEKIIEHPLLIQKYSSMEEIKTCHILFLNIGKPEQAITNLKDRNILIVGDTKDFIKKGGMINFVKDNNKIKIQINMKAVGVTNLIISSKLLRLAEIISP